METMTLGAVLYDLVLFAVALIGGSVVLGVALLIVVTAWRKAMED